MQQGYFTVIQNEPIAASVYRMVLSGDTSAISAPGQFVNIALEGKFLRRPISVCDWSDSTVTLIYKVVGEGTEQMAHFTPGKQLDVLTGLGNGYDTALSGENPLLIGGGAGVPPMYALCKELLAQKKAPRVILGFNTAAEVFYRDEFEKLGVPVTVTTADGTLGMKGFVTDAMAQTAYTYFYACGPLPMFRAIEKIAATSGQYSFEERMGCGFGACMGCTCQTKEGAKRLCKEGPVLKREEVVW